MPTEPNKKRVAVVGGGISGLVTARKLMDAGYAVDIYEASDRVGGKIQSATMGNRTVNTGAEFIDSDSPLMGLARDLNVPLVQARDQGGASYHMPDGSVISQREFLTAFQPIAKKIEEDKAILARAPNGERAQQINKMSLTQYLEELAEKARKEGPQLPIWKRATKFVFGWKDPAAVNPDIVKMAAQVYTSEAGRDAKHISALQFVNETCSDMSPESGRLLASDCGYRVEGGTEKIIEALKSDLKAKGANFHFNAKAKGISKKDGKFKVDFEQPPENSPAEFDRVVLAVPSHGLSQIQGLGALGLPAEDQQLLAQGQYSQSAKFFVKLKPEAMAKIQNDCFFSNEGYQAWCDSPGTMTFLIGGETANSAKGKQLMQRMMDSYAKAHGMKASEMFDTEGAVFRGPDEQRPCYASPAPGQTLQFVRMSQSLDRMAQQGVGVVGTYIPQNKPGGMSIGFMDGGLASSERAVGLMTGIDRAQTLAMTENFRGGGTRTAPPSSNVQSGWTR